MSSPKPPVALQDPCAVIVNEILYVYTANAFQSLPLKKGGTWSKLPTGVSVTGAACVAGPGSGAGTPDVLWLVGGTSSDATYPGLQQFDFTSNTWATITPQVPVTAGRINHAVAFLNDSASILMYAGGQNGNSGASLDTFTISSAPPYAVASYVSHGNMPVVSPSLLPWSVSAVLTVGGDPTNLALFTFDETNGVGWQELPTTLTAPVPSAPDAYTAIVTGDDGSKVLQIFDLTSSPNGVTQVVLEVAGGLPAPNGQFVGNTTTTRKRKRNTIASWPAYNPANAPTVTRSGGAIAQDASGLTVVVGGNTQDPVVMFDPNANSWVNTTQFFGAKAINQNPLIHHTHHSTQITTHHHSHHTTSSTPTSTHHTLSHTSSTSTAPSSTSTSSSGGMSDGTKLILGTVLGSVLGALLILLLIVWLCRCCRKRSRNRRRGYMDQDEKTRMSFADRGDPNMREAGGAIPYQMDGARSRSSLAILTGRAHGHRPTPSDSSTTHLVKKNGMWQNEPVELDIITERNAGGKTWQVSQSAAGSPSHRNRSAAATPTKRSPSHKLFKSLSKSSHKSESSSVHDCASHGPTEIPPLQLGQEFDGERINSVVTGSPRLSHTADLGRPYMASMERPSTAGSAMSSNASSTIGDTIFTPEVTVDDTTWTPVSHSNDWMSPGQRNTASSSIYEQTASDFNSRPSYQAQTFQAPQPQIASINNSTAPNNLTIWPRASIIPVKPDSATQPTTTTGSVAYVKPSAQQQGATQTTGAKPMTSDISWLNLGAQANGGARNVI